MSSSSSRWYRGTVQHALLWMAAGATFLWDDRVETGMRLPLSFALGLSCFGSFFAALVALAGERRKRAARLAYFLIAGLMLGLLALHGAYVRSVGALHAQAIEAILQTDFAEAYGYIATRLLALWAALWAAAATLLWLTFPPVPLQLVRRAWFQALLVATGVVCIIVGRGIVTKPLEIVQSYQEATRELRRAAAGKTQPRPPVATSFSGTVILVIGESTSRHHMSLYGYPRDTTPRLSGLAPHMVVFGDVIANHSSTVDSVLESMTLRGIGLDKLASGSISLVQLANAAGFETTWLSNQNEFGAWDNPVTILARQARLVRFHDRSLGELTSREIFDEAMLPSLDQALSSNAERKFIVVHLMSTHLPYCWTKPAHFNPLIEEFGKRLYGRGPGWRDWLKTFFKRRTKDLDCYDNGVRYVDKVVGSIIDRVSKLHQPTTVLYLSDHGEAPLLGTGHDSAEHSSYHLEIPFFLWGNAAYRAAHSRTWDAAVANSGKAFSLELMPPSLISLLGLKTPLLHDADSLFDPAFRPRPRYPLGGRIRYDNRWRHNDYRENSRVFVRELGSARARVWSHRVNSLGALLEAKRTFAGIEIDTHFDMHTRTFRVRHDYPDIGLTLRDMLEWSRDRPNLKIWLDWKNATPKNVQAALAQLTVLDREFGLKRRLLVETDETAVSPKLAVISTAAFRHGYYLPTERVRGAMREGDAAMAKLAAELAHVVIRGRFDAVTYDASLQPFVTSELDAFLGKHRLARYSWDTSIDAGSARTDPATVAGIVRQRRLEALLVTFPSDFQM